MNRAQQIRRILRTRGAVAPAWLTPELVLELIPIEGDIIERQARRCNRIALLCAVARRGVRDLERDLSS